MTDVFKYRDYKEFLRQKIAENAKRGYQTRLAEAAGCKRAFLSQVLHTHIHFTPDHAAGLCQFWEMNEVETDYYLSLLDHARAGTPSLRTLLGKRLERLRQSRENLKQRFQRPEISEIDKQSLYYSSWLWSAVHIGCTIPALQSEAALAKQLKVGSQDIREVLNGLEAMGLITHASDGRWRPTQDQVHLSKDSPFNVTNHVHWRNRAIHHLSQFGKEGTALNYTGVHSMSREDFLEIKELFLKAIDRAHEKITASDCEQLVCSNIDFFTLTP